MDRSAGDEPVFFEATTLGVAADDGELAPGMRVGEYMIDGKLGEGGMGRVYAATHPVIAKRAAIKVLHSGMSTDRSAILRFVQEARSVNQIGHPNIVDIFAFGALPDGRHYLVMEYLHGETLRGKLERGPLELGATLAIIDTITSALEAAHAKGIVHRDLKPDNVFLVEVAGADAHVKLLDFGIAKLLGVDRERTHATETGNLLGTPAYMSPEQARGIAIDHRTDIYALGAMFFELVTGKHVFPARSAADVIAMHLLEPPRSARSVDPRVPPRIDALIAQMLAKDVDQRPTLAVIRAEVRASRTGTPAPITARGQQHVTGDVAAPLAAPTGAIPTPLPLAPSAAVPAPRPQRAALAIGIALLGFAAAFAAVWLWARNPDDAAPPAAKPAPAAAPLAPAPPASPDVARSAAPVVPAPVPPAPAAAEPAPTIEPPADKASSKKSSRRRSSKRRRPKADPTTTAPATAPVPNAGSAAIDDRDAPM